MNSLVALAGAPLDQLGLLARMLAASIMVAIALCHAAWALGSSFPVRSRAELSQLVVGSTIRGKMPGQFATWMVAVLLLAAAVCVLALGSISAPGPIASLLRVASLLLVLVFSLRGVLGFFEVALRPSIRGTPYMTWSRRLYSPLSLVIALLIGVGIGGAA